VDYNIWDGSGLKAQDDPVPLPATSQETRFACPNVKSASHALKAEEESRLPAWIALLSGTADVGKTVEFSRDALFCTGRQYFRLQFALQRRAPGTFKLANIRLNYFLAVTFNSQAI